MDCGLVVRTRNNVSSVTVLRIVAPWILAFVSTSGLSSARFADDNTLQIWSAYTQPAHIGRVVVRNHGSDAVKIENISLKRRTDSKTLSPLWVTVEPRTLLSGQVALISWFLSKEYVDVLQPEIPHAFSEQVLAINDQEFPLTELQNMAIVNYAVRDDKGHVYLYVTGSSGSIPKVNQCYLDGKILDELQVITVPKANALLIMGKLSASKLSENEVPLLTIKIIANTSTEIRGFARLFNIHNTFFRSSANFMSPHNLVGTCLTHREKSYSISAEKTIKEAMEQWGKVRTIKFCVPDLANNGPFYFAGLAEQNHIEPQLAYPEACDKGNYITELLGSAENTNKWSVPGIFFTWIFAEDIHFKYIPSYSFPKLRAMIYSLLAGGSRGFEFQRLVRDDLNGNVGRNYALIQQEVSQLQSLVAISEPMDLVATAPPDSHVRTLLCGDQGILVFLLSKNSQPPLEAKEETLSLYAPRGIEFSSQAIEIGGAATIQEVTKDNNLLSFTSKPDLATVYFIPGKLEAISN